MPATIKWGSLQPPGLSRGHLEAHSSTVRITPPALGSQNPHVPEGRPQRWSLQASFEAWGARQEGREGRKTPPPAPASPASHLLLGGVGLPHLFLHLQLVLQGLQFHLGASDRVRAAPAGCSPPRAVSARAWMGPAVKLGVCGELAGEPRHMNPGSA